MRVCAQDGRCFAMYRGVDEELVEVKRFVATYAGAISLLLSNYLAIIEVAQP